MTEQLLSFYASISAKGLYGGPALHDRRALEHVASTWRAAEPLVRWLTRHVGLSTIPPEFSNS